MLTDIKDNFLHLDINNQIHLNLFMTLFNMGAQLQEEETGQQISIKDNR
jgi:hypothetical protein